MRQEDPPLPRETCIEYLHVCEHPGVMRLVCFGSMKLVSPSKKHNLASALYKLWDSKPVKNVTTYSREITIMFLFPHCYK